MCVIDLFLQVRQLVLDPAIQQEFGRLRRQLEEQRSALAQLKEQNDSLTFTAVSFLCSLFVVGSLCQMGAGRSSRLHCDGDSVCCDGLWICCFAQSRTTTLPSLR